MALELPSFLAINFHESQFRKINHYCPAIVKQAKRVGKTLSKFFEKTFIQTDLAQLFLISFTKVADELNFLRRTITISVGWKSALLAVKKGVS